VALAVVGVIVEGETPRMILSSRPTTTEKRELKKNNELKYMAASAESITNTDAKLWSKCGLV
jgi:hypothetical protein